jgi:uncharacterized protein YdcH (DUF465 family)
MTCKICENKVKLYYDVYDKELNMYIQAQISDGVMYIEDNYTEREFEINFCPVCGEELNPNGITIQHMKLSDAHYNKLVDKYDKRTVNEVIESMKNYGKLKKYKNAYLTANKWCKKRFKDKTDGWGDVE